MNIFVAKLNYRTTNEELEAKFKQFGVVDSAKVITERETGRSKGFGFVEMPNDEEAKAAIAGLNDTDFDGQIIAVKEAEPRENRGGGGFNGGGGFRKSFNNDRPRRDFNSDRPRRDYNSDRPRRDYDGGGDRWKN